MNHPQPLSTSYHEAGHAVAAWAAGAVVESANILSDGTQLGAMVHIGLSTEIERRLFVHIAGAVAESLASGGKGTNDDVSQILAIGRLASGSDVRKIDADLRRHYGGNPPPREKCREYQAARLAAKELLYNWWGGVRAIASRMRRHGQVSGPFCHAVLAAHKVDISEQ
jgi:hypothetical protein